MNGASEPLGKRTVLALLLFIVITGGLFRFAGLSSGYQRVEDVPVARQIQRNYLGDWHPDPVFYYPNFFQYMVAGLLRGVSAFFKLIGVQRDGGLFPFTTEQVLFAARSLSALLGTATILLVFAIGRRLYDARRGLIAAFVFSTAFIHILFSHQIVLDVPMTFFYALSLYGCLLIAQRRRWFDYALAGFWAGLAVATKYNGVFVFAAIFLAHWLTAPGPRRKLIRAVTDPKLYAAGATGVAAFFLGHPFALLRFKDFLGASRLLLRTVNETEWFLLPIQPKTLVEYIAYNKHVLALKNILSAEGPVLLGIILLGAAAACLRRNRKTAWLPLSGLVYFLAALGFLGFSRYRDMSTFTVFYAFLGMLGIELVGSLRVRPRALRPAPALAVAAALIALECGAAVKSYYLWEDDTTEMAERWIRRNVPERSYFGKEWFSPPLRGADYAYPNINKPYLFSSGLAPFSRFDYVITSSAAYGHFFRNSRFYADYLVPYSQVRQHYERVKDFFFWDIEYKNPELNLFRVNHSPGRRQRVDLPRTLSLDTPAREFESVDGSPYGKSSASFLLEVTRPVERTFISRRKISALAVFVSGAAGEGTIEIRNSGRSWRIRVGPGETRFVIFKPWLSFPFYRYLYRLSVRGTGSLGSAWVRVADDAFDIGSELARLGEWRLAKACLLEAAKERGPAHADLEIDLGLALCSRRLGQTTEAEMFAARAATNPRSGRYRSLIASAGDERTWRRQFGKFSGLDLDLFESLQADHFGGAAFEKLAPRNEGGTGGARDGEVRLVSPEAGLLPQRYRVELRFAHPCRADGPGPRLEVAPAAAPDETRPAALLPADGALPGAAESRLFTVEGRSVGERVRFVAIMTEEERSAFEGLAVYPDLRDFFGRKADLIRDLPDGPAGGGR